MTNVDAELIAAVTRLAQLGLSAAEAKSIRADLESILGHFQAIQDVDTEGVEPLAHVLSAHGEAGADEVQPFASPRETLVPLSALHREGFFVVPRVLAGPEQADGDETDPLDGSVTHDPGADDLSPDDPSEND